MSAATVSQVPQTRRSFPAERYGTLPNLFDAVSASEMIMSRNAAVSSGKATEARARGNASGYPSGGNRLAKFRLSRESALLRVG